MTSTAFRHGVVRGALGRIALLTLPALALLPARSAQEATSTVESPAAARERFLALAEEYATFEWTADEANVFHGDVPSGARVDTPDISFDEDGWHPDGRVNRGMPYSWGGFSSIEGFKQALADGSYAGNIPASSQAMGSGLAVGLDCSGFVARAWDLPIKQSTRTLAGLCYELGDYEELLPGDILNIVNGHVVLFKEWVDAGHERMHVYEAGHLRVEESEYNTAVCEQRGFVAMRYKPLDTRWVAMDLQGGAFVQEGEGKGRWIPDPAGAYPEFESLGNPLSDARPLEWAEYVVTDTRMRSLGSFHRTVMVARLDAGEIETQTLAKIDGKALMTGASCAESATLAEALIDFVALEEPHENAVVVAASAEEGEYALGDRRFPARRISAFCEATWSMHGVTRPLTLELDYVLSDEVPLQGVLEGHVMLEIVWDEDEEGELTVSRRELDFALKSFGGTSPSRN